jgi:hypothetical protein
MVVLVGMGERMAERFLPIYMLALGGGALAIGLLQAMDNLLSALYSFPGGYLSDRIGTKKSLLIFNLVAMAGFALVILVPPGRRCWHRGGALHLLVGHFPSGHHEPDVQGAAPKQAHHGGDHALFGQTHSHGARPSARRRSSSGSGASGTGCGWPSARPWSWPWRLCFCSSG